MSAAICVAASKTGRRGPNSHSAGEETGLSSQRWAQGAVQ